MSAREGERRSYFAHITFKDRSLRELAPGIEAALTSPTTNAEVKAGIQVRLDEVVTNAQTQGYIREDYKPGWFKQAAYEKYLKGELAEINREFNLGIRA